MPANESQYTYTSMSNHSPPSFRRRPESIPFNLLDSGLRRNDGLIRVFLAFGLACLLLGAGFAHADRFKQRGISIPDAPDMFVQGETHLDKDTGGAKLSVPLDVNETWSLLNRVLAGLAVKPREQDAQSHQLLTSWILWVWDAKSEIGQSKPPLKALSRTYERHRFEFSVISDVPDKAVIHISDSARQREVDIAPDSEYSWLQWQDAPVQDDAAWSFMRRLQGNFESALSSRLMPSIVPAAPVTPTTPPTTTVAPAAVIVEPAETPSIPATVSPPSIPRPTGSPSQNKPSTEERPQAIVNQPAKAMKKLPSERAAAVKPRPQAKTRRPARVGTPQNTPAPTPLAIRGGLLVDGGLDATWQALLPAIDALGIKLQSRDPTQHMLATQWINATYDKENQQLSLESKTGERWAYNIWGKGRERHKFQLILIPVENGVRTMVYAYHTGFQVETDQTPDSSQTLLYWKDHETDPAIAMAFLRRLRLVVKPSP